MSFLNKSNFKERPIDILPVIVQGIFMSVVGGLIIGSLLLLTITLYEFSLYWIMFFLFIRFLGKRLNQSFHSYHVLYACIACLSFVLSFYIMQITYYFGLFFINGIEVTNVYYLILNPFQYFRFLDPLQKSFYTTNNLIEVILFVIISIYAYRSVK